MAIGLVGRKCGMTRVFTDDGAAIPVTIIEAQPNKIVQIKTVDNDGYRALQITTGVKKASKLTKPELGHFAKAKVEGGIGLWEFRLDDKESRDFTIGQELKVDIFSEGAMVDVIGRNKGKGFAGVIKRYHFAMQDATHGNSLSHRAPGSIGQRQTPGRVFKGKKMAGHMGDVRRTIEKQKIVRIDIDKNLIFIKGAVPGATNGYVVVRPASKVKTKGGKHGA
jgi:large subunit ribosomal protein L3